MLTNPHPQIARTQRIFWKEKDAAQFYAEHEGRFYYNRLIAGMTWCVEHCAPQRRSRAAYDG